MALTEVYERMDAIGANTAEFRARKILTGLGFTDTMMENPTGGLSGGKTLLCKLVYLCSLVFTQFQNACDT